MSIYGVIKFQAPFERLKEYNSSPEGCLYKAILTQAIIDASNASDEKGAKKLELEAKNWIFGNSKYFQDVCNRAEINPENIMNITRKVIKLNLAKQQYIGYDTGIVQKIFIAKYIAKPFNYEKI
tara:strand:- start:123 stop:494 length:372 start_codon:yes stop_codon:yes gene_type:complete